MECQFSGGCLNIRMSSCKYCGKLFCGQHALTKYYPRDGIVTICNDCKKAIMKDRPKANGWWCVIALIGIALCILGGVITNGYPILVGLILLGFSVLVFLFSTFTAPALK